MLNSRDAAEAEECMLGSLHHQADDTNSEKRRSRPAFRVTGGVVGIICQI